MISSLRLTILTHQDISVDRDPLGEEKGFQVQLQGAS